MSATSEPVAAVRRFNRFYTRQVGALRRGLLGTEFSLTEARVLYELASTEGLRQAAQGSGLSAAQLCVTLGLDAGQLSRLLRRLRERGLVSRGVSPEDARRSALQLSPAGRRAFAELDRRSQAEARALLQRLTPFAKARALEAMGTLEALLGEGPRPPEPYLLRPPRAGELGWVVSRHGALYAQEFGWDERFEGLVAGVVSDFVASDDPRRERCWIAELGGRPVGSIFAAKASNAVCKLRLLLVEPEARGLGIGARLVDECVQFSRAVGYRKLTLWTNSVLVAARTLYQRAGFRRVSKAVHRDFGPRLTGETWELMLGGHRENFPSTAAAGRTLKEQPAKLAPQRS